MDEGTFRTLDKVDFLGKGTYRVKSIKLDDVIRRLNIKKVDLIKIDVEGAEYRVLRGGIRILKKVNPKLVIEIHENLGVNKDIILKFLSKFNYKVVHEYKASKRVYELFLS